MFLLILDKELGFTGESLCLGGEKIRSTQNFQYKDDLPLERRNLI